MTNKTTGIATKGSRFWMQNIVERHPELINKALGDTKLDWISPIKPIYQEYQLRSSVIIERIWKSSMIKDLFHKDFWPSKGRNPEWDGIAVGGTTLYLFEAKSHKSEVKGNGRVSNALIKRSLEYTFNKINEGNDSINESAWFNKYYQYANRLAFLTRFNDFLKNTELTINNVNLVFLDFVNDPTMDEYTDVPKNESEWVSFYENEVYPDMKITKDKLHALGVRHIHIDVGDIKRE